jgi:hypothetical protein
MEEIRSSESLGFRGVAMIAAAIGAVAIRDRRINHSAASDPPGRGRSCRIKIA